MLRNKSSLKNIDKSFKTIESEINITFDEVQKKAIKEALKYATGGGVLAILGKGGELYQDIAGEKLPYNDFEEVEKLEIE